MCVIGHLPELLRSQQDDALCRVVPILCVSVCVCVCVCVWCVTLSPPLPHTQNSLKAFSAEVQKAAGKAFQEIIEQELVPTHILTSAFLPTILSQLDSRDACKRAGLDRVYSSMLSVCCSPISPISHVACSRKYRNSLGQKCIRMGG